MRSMVVGSIRKDVPKDQADQFLVVFHNSATWKQVFGYARPDDAYLILLDPQGVIRWQHHGVLQDSDYQGLAETTRQLIQ
jgi:predicted transcriptional regulator